jgi:hypothetical protein
LRPLPIRDQKEVTPTEIEICVQLLAKIVDPGDTCRETDSVQFLCDRIEAKAG